MYTLLGIGWLEEEGERRGKEWREYKERAKEGKGKVERESEDMTEERKKR